MSTYARYTFTENYQKPPKLLPDLSHTEAPNWMLTFFYSCSLVFAAIAIVSGAGTVYTKRNCQSFQNENNDEGALAFEIFAWATIVMGSGIFLCSSLALIYKMGFSK